MRLKILFLDDEVVLGELFAEYFSDSETQIDVYNRPQDAIDASLKDPPDLVFLDYRMPQMTGDKAAAKMPPNIPKYLVTGEIDPNPTYAFDAVMKKPYDFELIQSIIDKAKAQKKAAA